MGTPALAIPGRPFLPLDLRYPSQRNAMSAVLPMNFSRFDVAMAEAVEAARMGFYFEEGGCWGMAEALFLALQSRGLKPQLVWRPTGFVHAWVILDGHNLDWRGSFYPAPGARPLASLAMLRSVAHRFGGASGERYLSDVADASAVVQAALRDMDASCFASTT